MVSLVEPFDDEDLVDDDDETVSEYIVRRATLDVVRQKDAKGKKPILVPYEMCEDSVFRPPEDTFRIGIRYDSKENYQKFGYISTDMRYLLTDQGEVYLLIDEQSLEVPLRHDKNFRELRAYDHLADDLRQSEVEALLKLLLKGGLSPSVQRRLIRWLSSGRFGM